MLECYLRGKILQDIFCLVGFLLTKGTKFIFFHLSASLVRFIITKFKIFSKAVYNNSNNFNK